MERSRTFEKLRREMLPHLNDVRESHKSFREEFSLARIDHLPQIPSDREKYPSR